MPRFPTYERQQGLGGGATASYASTDAFTAPGRALANMGGAVADLGFDIASEEQKAQLKIRETQDDAWFSKTRAQTAIDMITTQKEAQQAAAEDGSQYVDTVRGQFKTYRDSKVAEAPSPRARQMYEQWADSYDVDLTGKAATFQASADLAKRDADFVAAMNAHAQTIFADPTQYEAVRKRALDDFEGAKQWMTPEQETLRRAEIDKNLKLAAAKSKAEFQPDQFLQEVGKTTIAPAAKVAPDVQTRGQQAMGFFTSKGYTKEQAAGIVGNLIAESNLKPSGAVGDNGTAFGIAQWRGERLTRLKRFANANGREWTDFETQLAFVDMELQNHETGAYEALKSAKTVDEATAAFIGYERPAGWSKGNPRGGHNYKGRLSNAAAMAGVETASFHEGGDFSQNPLYAGLSVDEILSLSNSAQTTISARDTANYAALKGNWELMIATGQVLSGDDILASNLRSDDKASLLTRWKTQNKDELAVQETLSALSGGGWSGNAYDTDARKNIDGAYDQLAKQKPEQKQAVSEAIVEQTGIVPKAVLNELRAGLESRDAASVAAAAQAASRLSQIDPAALGRRDGGSEVQDAATAFDHYTNTVGLSAEEAGKRLLDARDPEKAKERAALMESKPVKDFIKNQATEGSVRDIFDPGALGFDPVLGETAAASAAIVGEYRSILEESIFDAAGDTGLGKTIAAERLQRVYGASPLTLSGEKIVTRLPPEKTYPAGPDGTHEYIREQMQEALAAEGVEFDDVFLQSDVMTDADFRTGKPARYQVFYVKDNVLSRYNLPFYALPPSGPSLAENRASFEQNRAMEERIEGLSETMPGMANNPIMSTDPNAVNPSPKLDAPSAEEFREKNKELGIRTQYRRTN